MQKQPFRLSNYRKPFYKGDFIHFALNLAKIIDTFRPSKPNGVSPSAILNQIDFLLFSKKLSCKNARITYLYSFPTCAFRYDPGRTSRGRR